MPFLPENLATQVSHHIPQSQRGYVRYASARRWPMG